jgi:Na+-driven multidrug efflux pump
VPASWLLSSTRLGLNGIWIAVSFSFAVSMTVSLIYYFSGRWKTSTVIKAPAILPLIE